MNSVWSGNFGSEAPNAQRAISRTNGVVERSFDQPLESDQLETIRASADDTEEVEFVAGIVSNDRRHLISLYRGGSAAAVRRSQLAPESIAAVWSCLEVRPK